MKIVAMATIFALVWGSFLPAYIAIAEETTTENPGQSGEETSLNEPAPQGENGENGTTENPDGQDGGAGLDGGEEPAPQEGEGTDGEPSDVPSDVTTGDATATGDTSNETNSNDVTTPGSGETDIDATNNATTTATTTADALTGENTAEGDEGSASISTGNAVASGNAINVINTNIIDSTGMLLFLNLLFGGGFDFRSLDLSYFFGGGSSSGCSFSSCDGADVNIDADNTATVLNSVIVRANTGGNTCTAEGDCSIATGDAYASGNAVNLVNSNIINSNYLLVSFNSFGDMGGDIVLPGADFFSQLLAQNNPLGGSLNLDAQNTATVTDSTSATANTGDNTAEAGEGSASVDTGNAVASATTYNQVNSNLVGGTQIFFLFRIWGDWGGTITGLPDGMSWAETPYGIELFNSNGSPASTAALSGGASGSGGELDVDANNTADVTNNVEVYALTGENRAQTASSTASIATGNAYAAANSVNVVNTNLIGRNWIFAIFNIFGNFTGNISFGQPDLWIGATAEAGNPTLPGTDVTYKFTVSNMGDSDASNVRLTANFVKEMLDFEGTTESETGAFWDLGNIKKGESKEFLYRARTGLVPDGASVAVPLTASVTSRETDSNPSNNTEELDIVVMSPIVLYGHSGPGKGEYTVDPKLTVQKIANVAATSAPALVDYAIIVQNDGGAAYDVKVVDTLMGPKGKVGDQTWKLGTVKSGEEVRIEYTVKYGADIVPGIYTNTATLTGTKNFDVNVYSTSFEPIVVSNKLEIRPRGEVLGEAIAPAPQCEPYLTEYIRPGRANSTKEVTKLQSFLMEKEGEVGLRETGRYDNATIAAVKRFQAKYLNEILAPWGIQAPTGSVYYTTQKKINELMCSGEKQFDLSSDQQNEINSFKANVPNLPANYNFQNVGGNPVNEDYAGPAEAKPSVPAIFKMPSKIEEGPTSLKFPKWMPKWMVSMVPFVSALER